jgi:serine/threonine protein kinase
MEFVEGESLGQRIDREQRLTEAEAVRIVAQIALGLDTAHAMGLIHRDVKPDNILLTSDGQAKLTDMGLVKEIEADLNLTRTGRGLGTPHFMAPEQFRNAKNADARCDIYSLAATLYHMVTGELPFKSSGPLDAWMKKINNELVPARTLVPELSERIDWALRRAMSVDRDHRPATCREFVEDLTGHSTRRLSPSAEVRMEDVWYLVYTDEDSVARTVKGTLQGIRRSLKEGLLGDASNVRAARTKSGPFEVLRNHPEFRDVVLTLERTPPAGSAAAGATKTPVPKGTPKPQPPAAVGVSAQPVPAAPPLPSKQRPPGASGLRLAPHIDLETTRGHYGSIMWMTLLFCAACLAATGYFLLPVLFR